MDTDKQKFIKNPGVNPVNGDVVKIGGCKYKKLTTLYGDVKITSPKTGNKITVGKGEYKKLIKSKEYSEQYLLSLIEIPEYVKSPVSHKLIIKEGKTYNRLVHQNIIILDDDQEIVRNKLLNLDIKAMDVVCELNVVANKIALDQQFWKEYYLQHKVPYFTNDNDNIYDIINTFNKIKTSHFVSQKFVNNIINARHFRSFKCVNVPKDQCQWLDNKLKKVVDIHFTIKMPKKEPFLDDDNTFYISLYHGDSMIGKNKMDKNEFVLKLTQLFYYVDKCVVTNDKVTFKYDQLKCEPANKNVKEYFSQW